MLAEIRVHRAQRRLKRMPFISTEMCALADMFSMIIRLNNFKCCSFGKLRLGTTQPRQVKDMFQPFTD